MEKKINKKIQTIILENDVLLKLNEVLEGFVLNCTVIVFVDFLTYKKNHAKLEELKSCALNNLVLKVVKFGESVEKLDVNIDETCGFLVCVGEEWLLNLGQIFAIKNNINYGFVNLFSLKTSIFLKKNDIFQYFPPSFMLVEKNNLDLKQKFSMLCEIFSYSYLLLENIFNFENKELENFANDYLVVIKNLIRKGEDLNVKIYRSNLKEIGCEDLYDNFIAFGLLLQKYNINKKFINGENQFKNYIKTFILALSYKSIFLCLNNYNFEKTQIKFLDDKEILNYNNFDFCFYRTFLLNFRNRFIKNLDDFLNFNLKLLDFLKESCFNEYYLQIQNFSNLKMEKEYFDNTFLKKMRYFNLFDLVLKSNCLKA